MKTISIQLTFHQGRLLDRWMSDHLIIYRTNQSNKSNADVLETWQWERLKPRTAIDTSDFLSFSLSSKLANALAEFIEICQSDNAELRLVLDCIYGEIQDLIIKPNLLNSSPEMILP